MRDLVALIYGSDIDDVAEEFAERLRDGLNEYTAQVDKFLQYVVPQLVAGRVSSVGDEEDGPVLDKFKRLKRGRTRGRTGSAGAWVAARLRGGGRTLC
jgi:hypothetical protein